MCALEARQPVLSEWNYPNTIKSSGPRPTSEKKEFQKNRGGSRSRVPNTAKFNTRVTGAIPSDTGENERRRPNWLVMRAGNFRRSRVRVRICMRILTLTLPSWNCLRASQVNLASAARSRWCRWGLRRSLEYWILPYWELYSVTPPLFFWNSFFSLVGRGHSILSYLDNSTRSNLFPRLQRTHCCHHVRFCQSLLWTNPARLLPVSCFISVEATAYLAYQTPSRISFGWVVRLWSISATVHHYSRLPHMPCRVQPSLFRLFKFAPCYNTWF